MEQLLPLPQTNPTATYRRYSIFREADTAPVAQIHSREFFYIGKNTRSIDYLVKLFDGGYAAENVNKALNILRRIDQQEKTSPNVFIIDSNVDLTMVAELCTYLKSTGKFSGIPMIMDKSGSTEATCDAAILMRLFDDVIDTRKADAKLLQRITFLERVKSKKQQRTQEKMNLMLKLSQESTVSAGRRLFNLVVAGVGIIITLPVMILIAFGIMVESRGSVFYISKRAGRGYRVFNFYKFRTMRFGADTQVDSLKHLNEFDEAQGRVFFKVSDDPRATKFGKFLRNTSLDELPQLFNVILGDMSIVGNRPLPLYDAAMLTTDEWSQRFMAPAGITGLWQIRKKDRHCMSVEERIKLDIAYSQKQNFLFDLWIIAHTPPALIQKSNA